MAKVYALEMCTVNEPVWNGSSWLEYSISIKTQLYPQVSGKQKFKAKSEDKAIHCLMDMQV